MHTPQPHDCSGERDLNLSGTPPDRAPGSVVSQTFFSSSSKLSGSVKRPIKQGVDYREPIQRTAGLTPVSDKGFRLIEPSATARARMVRDQLQWRGIRDPGVLQAMGSIPRERFLRPGFDRFRQDPYADGAQSIGRGQTLSQPYMVAAMTEALQLPDQARVLEVGTGSGYHTAVLAHSAAEVWTVERDPVLSREAKERLDDLGILNVRFLVGDGSLGWADGSPYLGILVTAGAPNVPAPLVAQIAPEGRLVIPVGSTMTQRLLRVTQGSDGSGTTTEKLMGCRFVPLIGQAGWDED